MTAPNEDRLLASSQIANLKKAIAAQESLRPTLGDEVVDATLAILRKQLAELEAQAAPPEQQRKQITVLFADVSGFTAMSEIMDAEDLTEVMNALWTRMDTAIIEHSGMIDKHIGDAVMALWGTRQAREDDPEQAIRAALEMHAALVAFRDEYNVQLGMRIGINTGPVLLGEIGTTGEFTAMGDAVNTASRLEHAAPVGGTLISHDTYRHVRGIFDVQILEPISVKGKQEPIQIYLVERTRPRTFRTTTRGVEGIETRMIGRDDQLKNLQEALHKVIESGERHTIIIFGEAGVGKSRLLQEFDNWIELLPETIYLFKGRASEEMQNLPYALLRDVFTFQFQIHESDPPKVIREKIERGISKTLSDYKGGQMRAHFIGQLIGIDFSHSPHLQGVLDDAQQLRDRALVYISDYFEAMTARRPTVIFLEDIHWADDSSLDVIDRLFSSIGKQRLIIVCATRPTLFERRPGWKKTGPGHTLLELHPLSRHDSRLLVDEILQRVENVPDALREIVVGNAEGNPFYMEELVKMLIEDSVIIKGEKQWRIEPIRLATVRIPPTLTGVLQARFDTLPSEERVILQRSSVIGRTFWADAVAYLGRPDAEKQAPSNTLQILEALRGREMIFRQRPSTFANTQEYIFKHVLLREATYESVLKRDRRTYHAHAAEWLISHSGEPTGRVLGMIAEHMERAGQAQKAVIYLKRAGEQAAAQFANVEAVNYFTRALKLTPESQTAERYVQLLARERVYHLQGERTAQAQELDVLEALVEILDDTQRRAEVALRRASYCEVISDFPAAMSAAQQAVQWAQRAGSPSQQVQGLIAWARALWRQGNFDEARGHLIEALYLAREHGDQPGEATSLHNLGTVYFILNDHRNARKHLEQAITIRRSLGDQRREAVSLNNLAGVYHTQGDFVQAKVFSEQARAVYQAIGDRWNEAGSLSNLGAIHHALGELSLARDLFLSALTLYKSIDDRRGEALAAMNLGLVLHDLGDDPAARRYCEQALEISRATGDREGEGYSLTYLALALEGLGELGEAANSYQHALKLRREIGQTARAIDDLAGLAHVALRQGQQERALSYAEEALAWITDHGVIGIEYPLRIYLSCADILIAVSQQTRAVEVLTAAQELLQERAARISDEAARQTFLEQAPLHRQLRERLSQLG